MAIIDRKFTRAGQDEIFAAAVAETRDNPPWASVWPNHIERLPRYLQRRFQADPTPFIAFALAMLCTVLACFKFHSIWAYQLSRWAISAGGAYAGYRVAGWRKLLFFGLAVIHNPIQPITFGELWPRVNAISALSLLVSLPHFPNLMAKFLVWWFTPYRTIGKERNAKLKQALEFNSAYLKKMEQTKGEEQKLNLQKANSQVLFLSAN